ncbi:MAG: hypothetical protein WB471_12705 [Nocardioides sp.]
MKRFIPLFLAAIVCGVHSPSAGAEVLPAADSRGSWPPASAGSTVTPIPGPRAGTVVAGRAPRRSAVTAFARTSRDLEIGEVVDAVELPVLLDATTGAFEVRADLAVLPDHVVARGGIVDVQVMARERSGAAWVDHTSARAVLTAAGTRWMPPDAPAPESRTEAVELRRTGNLDGVEVGSLTELGTTPSARTGAGRGSGSGECRSRVINSHWFDANLGAVFPVGRTRAWIKTVHEDGGSYQVALKVPKHPVEKAEMMRAAGSWGAVGPKVRTGTKYVGTVKYHVIDNRYRVTDGSCQYYLSYEPQQESGQFDDRSAKRPRFRHCRRVAGGSDWYHHYGSDKRYRLATAVSAGAIVGVSLEYRDVYEPHYYEVHYRIRGKKKMCGSDAPPATASRVMEKRA